VIETQKLVEILTAAEQKLVDRPIPTKILDRASTRRTLMSSQTIRRMLRSVREH
jgi:hypothetical protein